MISIIEQWLSFLWEWVQPKDIDHLGQLFALGYVVFFPLFALRREGFLFAVLGLSFWVGIQSALFIATNSNAFNFPYGEMYYFLGTLPYFIAGVLLSAITAYPLTSLWVNVAELPAHRKKDAEDFSIIDGAKRRASHFGIFAVTLVISPILVFTANGLIRGRFRSQALQKFASKTRLPGAVYGFELLNSIASHPVRALAVAFVINAISLPISLAVFEQQLFLTLVDLGIKHSVDVVIKLMFVATILSLLAAIGWLNEASLVTDKKLAKWVHGLQLAAGKLIAATIALIVFAVAVEWKLLPIEKSPVLGFWLLIGSVYVIAQCVLIQRTILLRKRVSNLPAGAIAFLSVSPVWAFVFHQAAPPQQFLPSFIAFALLASDYVFTQIYGEHLPVWASRFLWDRLTQSAESAAQQDTSLELYKASGVAGIQIKLKRSQRTNMFGTLFFVLDVRMAVNSEDLSLIRKYQLQKTIVYDSKSRQRYEEAARVHLESAREQPALAAAPEAHFMGVAKTFYRLTRATVSATSAALALRITIMSLLKGIHIECKSMNELLEGESAIVTAARNLKIYLETAATFDGREEILEL
jgi:hypothetical protein